MTIGGYVSTLLNYKHLGTNIGDQAITVLFEFLEKESLSIYNVYSNFKRTKSKTAYKDIHGRIKRLESLEFLDPIEVKDASNRGAKYYRISEAGVFQLFLQSTEWFPYFVFLLAPMLEAHGNYFIFETLLYPYFKKQTLLDIRTIPGEIKRRIVAGDYDIGSSDINEAIYVYLRNCCIEIYRTIMMSKSFIKDLKVPDDFEILDTHVTSQKNELIMKLLLYFRSYKEAKRMDALVLLAQDDNFMKNVDDLHIDFQKAFNVAMRLGGRS